MPILPVLDLMQGQIVHAVAGRRDGYRPIVSKLAPSADPVAIALALQGKFGFDEFYLADLDAIQNGEPNLYVYRKLQMEGFRLWVDAGVRNGASLTLKMLIIANIPNIILGLESVENPDELRHMVGRIGSDRAVFSLDLKDGKPLADGHHWATDDAFAIAHRSILSMGVRRMIALDLARVGVGQGSGTEELCIRIKQAHPAVSLSAGGGVRGIDDVRRLDGLGIDHVLVASALHDGRINADDVKRI
jgi:phosphoribosylformimino-5-aminoimidazole carboxamide ribotide isomerase